MEEALLLTAGISGTSSSASRVTDEQCRAIIQKYNAKQATVPEMLVYPGCVEQLHPRKVGVGEISGLVVLCLLTRAVMNKLSKR